MKLKHKKLASALILFSFLSYMPLSTTAALALDAGAMPDINNSINGSVTNTGNKMDVVVNGGAGTVGQFDWNSFNVGSNGHVNFGFTNNSQTSLNRVLATGGLSQIYGRLTNSCVGGDCSSYMGTGKVILINPNGIMFGAGSQVDLNSFTATTFDLKGAKNIKDMTAEELAAYKTQINIQGTDADGNVILSDMVGENAQFIRNGVLKTTDGAAVTLEGSKFNIDKSLGIAADNVAIYKDSMIKTNLNPNYGGGNTPANHNQSFSNVRIVTGDGVNFGYQLNGNIKQHKVNPSTNNNIVNNIDINGATIQSGRVEIENAGKTAGSNVNIKNSVIKGVKLVNNEYGDIIIKGANDVNIDNTHLQTANTHNNKLATNTYSQNGGRISVSAGKNVTLTNSKVETAYADKNYRNEDKTGAGAGDITIAANGGTAKIENTNLHAKGDLTVAAAGKLNAKDSVLRARNYDSDNAAAADLTKRIQLISLEGITLDNTYSESTDATTLNTPGSIDIKNNSLMYTTDKALNLYGTDTTIADSTLVYSGLNFVDPTARINNVTIKGTTALQDRTPYTDGLTVSTNGNLTIDGNSLLKRGFSATVDKDTLDMNVTLDPAVNQDKITLTSTGGKVTIKDSNVATNTGDIIANALDATKGEVFVQNSTLTSAKDIKLNQALTHTAGTHITKDSTLNAKNIAITTKNSNADIVADQDNFATLNYTERLALNAGRDNIITGSKKGGLAINKVDFNAKRNNSVNYNTKDSNSASNVLNITDSTFNAKGESNTIATNGTLTVNNIQLNGKTNDLASLYEMNLNNVEVLAQDDTAPENTKTILRAGTDMTTNNTALKLNQTKLIADSNKKMDLVLVGAQNKKAGIEINASDRNNGVQNPLVNKTGDVELYNLKDTDVKINAGDNVLAISKIKSGNLTLDKNDTFLAALTDLTASEIDGVTSNADGRAYIEVANWGQFNLDPLASFNQFIQPDTFTYTDHFVPGKHQPAAGDAIDTYKKHFIEFNSNGSMEKFLLVYEKPVSGCVPPPEVDPDPVDPFDPGISDELDSLINQIRLPRQLEPTSRVAPIANNTTDPTTGIVNAAARIEVDSNTTLTNNKDEDEFQI